MPMRAATARTLIGEGGPLRRFEARIHLTRPLAQIVTVLTVTWLPIMLLAAVTRLATGEPVRIVHDSAMHVRLLVATPLLLFLDRVFPSACTYVADRLLRDGYIQPADRPRFDELLARIRRLCEAGLPELSLAVTALVLGAATLFVTTSTYGLVLRAGLTAADWWFALLALPLFEFLIFRSLWRWAIWLRFLAGLSRLKLDLDPMHPDRRAGISFLRKPSLAYCSMVLFAISAVLSAAWVDRFRFETLSSFLPLLLVLAGGAVIVAFGPLLLFSFQLQRAKTEALDALGGLAVRNGRWFRDRWMDSAGGEAVASNDVQSLSAIASTYRETVKQIPIVLFEKKDLLLVLLATLLPVVPTMLVRIPHDEWMLMASFLF